MSLRSVESSKAARLAVVGAETPVGTRVREALAERGVAGSRVDLYGTIQDEVVLSEYAGEARLIQQPQVAEIVSHELIFLCETGALATDVATAASPGALVIDLVEALPSSKAPLLLHLAVNPDSASRHRGFVSIPHPVAIVLSELLHPLERELGVSEVVAMVLRPAADFGEDGVEELREQTVKLLNFGEVPVETFGRQLAFNLIPQARIGSEKPDLERSIAREVAKLLGWEPNRIALKMLTVPVFYGHGLQLRFRLRNGASLDKVRAVLDAAGCAGVSEGETAATPLEVSGERQTVLSELSEDGLGGFWLWAVAGETGAKNAEQAVRVAATLGEL